MVTALHSITSTRTPDRYWGGRFWHRIYRKHGIVYKACLQRALPSYLTYPITTLDRPADYSLGFTQTITCFDCLRMTT